MEKLKKYFISRTIFKKSKDHRTIKGI